MSANLKEELNALKTAVALVRDLARSFHVCIVANLRDGPIVDDYPDFSLSSEYFTGAEVDELLDGFRGLGCGASFVNGEREFLELASSGFLSTSERVSIVYNASGAGTRKGRSAVVPSVCGLMGIAHCSNDTYTSVLADNKTHVADLLLQYGFPSPREWRYDPDRGWLTGPPEEGLKVISKPCREFSSIGVSAASVAVYPSSIEDHVKDLSRRLRQTILVQEFIEGDEVEVPVFDLGCPVAAPSVGISQDDTAGGFLTHDDVLHHRYSMYDYETRCPELGQQLRHLAIRSCQALEMRGPMRVDFRICSSTRTPWIIDFNNYPHLTKSQSFTYSAAAAGLSHSDMLALVVFRSVRELAIKSGMYIPESCRRASPFEQWGVG